MKLEAIYIVFSFDHEGSPVFNIQIGGNGASTARLYIFVECALSLEILMLIGFSAGQFLLYSVDFE